RRPAFLGPARATRTTDAGRGGAATRRAPARPGSPQRAPRRRWRRTPPDLLRARGPARSCAPLPGGVGFRRLGRGRVDRPHDHALYPPPHYLLDDQLEFVEPQALA